MGKQKSAVDGSDTVPDAPLGLADRVLHAASVLRGRSSAVTPAQLLAWRLELLEQQYVADQLRIEWSDQLERLERLYNRIAARERRAEQLEQQQHQQQQLEQPDIDPSAAKDELRRIAFGG